MKKTETVTKIHAVTPVNDIQSSLGSFDWHWSMLDGMKFETPSIVEALEVEIIRCKPGETEAVLKEIDGRGFIPAPSPYVLGLGVQHPAVIKEHGWIVSLDEQNVLLDGSGGPCFLDLDWSDGRGLSLAERAGGWDDDWWFAVVRKDSSELVPKPLSTETLSTSEMTEGQMISALKEKGYAISKNF